MTDQDPTQPGAGAHPISGANAPSTGVTGQGEAFASPGHDIGGVGGSSAIGGGLGANDSRGNAAGTGIGGGAATGEALNDLGVAAGGLGTDADQIAPGEDALEPPPGPGASGDRG